jgi:hypothetical protein
MSETEYFLGADPAKSHDYFGIVVLQRIDKIIRLVALKELKLDYTVVADYIETLNAKYHFRKIFLDQTGAGNVFVDMLKHKGFSVEGITLSNPKKVEIIETVIRLMQEERIRLPRKGAYELKQQLQEQERDLTQSGMIRFMHPSNVHDDLFWAFCIGAYGIKNIIDKGTCGPILVTRNWDTSARESGISNEELLSDLYDKPGITVTDVARYDPS